MSTDDVVGKIVTGEWDDLFRSKVTEPKPSQQVIRILWNKDSLSCDDDVRADLYCQIDHAIQVRKQLMKDAVRYVLSLGYKPSDCEIKYDVDFGIETDRLFVNQVGRPKCVCFEVRTLRSKVINYQGTITLESKVIGWPDPLESLYTSSVFKDA